MNAQNKAEQIAKGLLADGTKLFEQGREMIARAEADLAKLAEPKLRHWDYGYDEDGDPCLMTGVQDSDELKAIDAIALAPDGAYYKVREVKGNLEDIFCDLERNSKDLYYFEAADYQRGTSFKIEILNKRLLLWTTTGSRQARLGCRDITLDEAIEIHQKLGQLIATQQRILGEEK